MTGASVVLLSIAGVMAILNWFAVARVTAVLEYVSKPLTTAALLALAASFDTSHGASWGWTLAALAMCLGGDVFLMLPRDAFVSGLASFAVAQIMFTVGFLMRDVHAGRVVTGLVLVVPVALLLLRRFLRAIRQLGHTELVPPIVVYVTVISVMAVSSIGAGSGIATAGAFLFMVSDSLIAESRFVKLRTWHPVGIMVTYHFALAGLVLGLL